MHLLQICLVYVNTLMIQEVLSAASWAERLTEEDMRGLTPKPSQSRRYTYLSSSGSPQLLVNQGGPNIGGVILLE